MKRFGTIRISKHLGTMLWPSTRCLPHTPFLLRETLANLSLKKYHSLAAKGEQIDLDKLEKDVESQELLKTAATQSHQQPLPDSTHSATGASAQATAAAEHVNEASMPAIAVPYTATGHSVPSSTNRPPAGAAMPQALLSTSKC